VAIASDSMTDTPWTGDACGLVDAYRKGEITPPEALERSLAAMESSALNAFSFVDADAARRAAASADVDLPFGGVPMGIKELDPVEGWPYTEASLVFADRVADHTATHVRRLVDAGAVLAGQTTASEFGGINVTHTKLHGTTRNPWNHDRTPGGSSGGSAAAVAGGLLPIASGGDGGGSIRIPAGHTGMFGLKSNYGRIPRGHHVHQIPHTVTFGCISRSVRDTARWFDVCNGYDPHDTMSLPRVGGWEAGLGSHRQELRGMRAAVAVDLGVAVVHPDVARVVEDAARALIADAGLTRVDMDVAFPPAVFEWAMSNLVTLAADLGDRYPACEQELTGEIMLGMNIAAHHYDLDMAAKAERFRVDAHEVMANLLDHVDFIVCATNPDVAFAAEGPIPTRVGEVDLIERFGGDILRAGANQGNLTIPANFSGNPAVSIPAGSVDGLPVGMQVIGRHHREELLLDLALIAERERPWPLVAPGAPH
jgi:aspartyl-tRNA(Asn)/glutamyl-tRNA(Gln) amidotransferase subunit A